MIRSVEETVTWRPVSSTRITGRPAGAAEAPAEDPAPELDGGALALACGPGLNALALGDDVARTLGQRVGVVRLLAAAAVVLLVGAATAVAGPIAFVGPTVPRSPGP